MPSSEPELLELPEPPKPICRPPDRCPDRRTVVFLREHTYLRREAAVVTCPNCLRGVETVVERRCTLTTHLSALLLLPICLCMLPYFSTALRDAVHRCPACGIHLGSRFASARDALLLCLQGPGENDARSL